MTLFSFFPIAAFIVHKSVSGMLISIICQGITKKPLMTQLLLSSWNQRRLKPLKQVRLLAAIFGDRT